MCSGREFQVWAAATGKARLPTVASLTGGTTRRLVPAERRALRPGTSTVEVSGLRYRGALSWRTGVYPWTEETFTYLLTELLSSLLRQAALHRGAPVQSIALHNMFRLLFEPFRSPDPPFGTICRTIASSLPPAVSD